MGEQRIFFVEAETILEEDGAPMTYRGESVHCERPWRLRAEYRDGKNLYVHEGPWSASPKELLRQLRRGGLEEFLAEAFKRGCKYFEPFETIPEREEVMMDGRLGETHYPLTRYLLAQTKSLAHTVRPEEPVIATRY